MQFSLCAIPFVLVQSKNLPCLPWNKYVSTPFSVMPIPVISVCFFTLLTSCIQLLNSLAWDLNPFIILDSPVVISLVLNMLEHWQSSAVYNNALFSPESLYILSTKVYLELVCGTHHCLLIINNSSNKSLRSDQSPLLSSRHTDVYMVSDEPKEVLESWIILKTR